MDQVEEEKIAWFQRFIEQRIDNRSLRSWELCKEQEKLMMKGRGRRGEA